MLNFLYRLVVGALGYVAFIWIVPLFLAVIEVAPSGALWQLIKAVAAVAVVAYAVWGRHTVPWGGPP